MRRARTFQGRCLVACGLSLAASGAWCQTRYRLTVVSDQFFPNAMGNDGTVFGGIGSSDKVWDPVHGLSLIPAFPGDYWFTDIERSCNNLGAVAGYGDPINATGRHGVVWDREHGTRRVGDFADPSEAVGVNDSGRIVGHHYDFNTLVSQPWFAEADGTVREIEQFQGFSSVPRAINNRGEAAGQSRFTYALYWDAEGRVTRIPALPRTTQMFSWDINDSGQVVGGSEGAGNPAWIWKPDGSMKVLNYSGASSFTINPSNINNSGTVVGRLTTNFRDGGCVWTEQDGAAFVDDLLEPGNQGWHIGPVSGLNDLGVMAAGAIFQNKAYTVLLTPVPEPGMFVAFGAGLLAVVGRKRTR